MELILSIITGSPIWVWAILAYIVFVGINATKQQIVFVPRLFIVPAILMYLRIQEAKSTDLIYYLCAGLIVGFIVGYFFKSPPLKVIKQKYQVQLTGSYFPLILLLIIFSMEYTFGVLGSMKHPFAQQYKYIKVLFSMLISGFFLGKAVYYLRRLNCKS